MIVYEERNYIVGISDKVTVTEDLDNPNFIRFRVTNTAGEVLGEYFTSKLNMKEEEYAKITSQGLIFSKSITGGLYTIFFEGKFTQPRFMLKY